MAHPRVLLATSLALPLAVFLGLFPAAGVAQTANHLLISEVLYDAPQSGTDSPYEWVEIYNPTGAPVDLAGWTLRDSAAQDAIPAFTLGPGQYLVVAATAAGFFANYPGFDRNLVAIENAIGNGLGNTGDRVVLADGNGFEVDAMSYGTDAGVLDPPCPGVLVGWSLARVPSAHDTDTVADWLPQETPSPDDPGSVPVSTPTVTSSPTLSPTTTPTPGPSPTATHTRTPGPTWTTTASSTDSRTSTSGPSPTETATPTPSPSPTATTTPSGARLGDVIINEIMQNPKVVSDASGEWVELFNATDHPVDLNGWTLRDEGSDLHRINNGGPLWLAPGGFIVLGRSADPFVNGSVAVDYAYRAFTLGNADDEVILLDGLGTEIDRVAYDGGLSFPDPDGASMALVSPALDNALGQNWHASVSAWAGSAGDLGSPGAANPLPPSPSPTASPTATPTLGPSATSTRTPTPGPTWTASASPTRTPTKTATLSPTVTGTHTPGPSPTATTTPTPSPSPTAIATASDAQPGDVIINEIMQNPKAVVDTYGEWVELFNTTDHPVDLNGWTLRDEGSDLHQINSGGPLWLAPGGYVILGRNADPLANGGVAVDYAYRAFTLGNTDDEVILLDALGTEVDRIAYDGGVTFPNPDGASMALISPALDNALGRNWRASVSAWSGSAGDLGSPGVANPAPPPEWKVFLSSVLSEAQAGAFRAAAAQRAGAAAQEPETPTPTPTAELPPPTETATLTPEPATVTPTEDPTVTETPSATEVPTASPTPTTGPSAVVRLNEVLPRPAVIDWDGNGVADERDEWIEIVNLGPDGIDLGGWALDDIPNGGTTPYIFPAGTLLAPGEFLVRYRSTTGVALNQDRDTARLLAPDGADADTFSYSSPGLDRSYSRSVDGTGDWTETFPPSPGGPNRPATLTPSPSPSPTAGAGTVTPSPTGAAYDRTAIRLNEFLPYPSVIDWDHDGTANAEDEWIELHNQGTVPIDLGGWTLDDIPNGGSKPYVIPANTWLAPGAFLLFFHDQTSLALNNDTDTVRLLGPDGAELESYAYNNPHPDRSYSRTAGGGWTDTYPPSPGSANLPPPPTPTATATSTGTPFPADIALNEILPDPDQVDWDENGTADFSDEWIELYNAGTSSANLGGWAIADPTKAYTMPVGTVIWPHAYLLLFRAQTHLSLGDSRDEVVLLRPDGSIADAFQYTRGPGNDRSYCRTVDGAGTWTARCEVTPGRANRALPEPPDHEDQATPPPAPFFQGGSYGQGNAAIARAAPPDTRVTMTGAVTLPPGLFGRSIYIQDDTGGIRLYLRQGDYPPLAVGDQVRVTGWTRDYHGEVELSVPDPRYLERLGPGAPPPALRVRTGQVGEPNEGRLIWIIGRVLSFEPQGLTLNDGSGSVEVYFPEELSWRRPWVEIGEFWAAQGVVGQYAATEPYVGGYRIIPRFKADVSPPPAFLPVTGGDMGHGDTETLVFPAREEIGAHDFRGD
jgi:hypothetical protein